MGFQTNYECYSKENRCQIPRSTYIYRLLYKWGCASKGTYEKICKNCISKKKKRVLKKSSRYPDCSQRGLEYPRISRINIYT